MPLQRKLSKRKLSKRKKITRKSTRAQKPKRKSITRKSIKHKTKRRIIGGEYMKDTEDNSLTNENEFVTNQIAVEEAYIEDETALLKTDLEKKEGIRNVDINVDGWPEAINFNYEVIKDEEGNKDEYYIEFTYWDRDDNNFYRTSNGLNGDLMIQIKKRKTPNGPFNRMTIRHSGSEQVKLDLRNHLGVDLLQRFKKFFYALRYKGIQRLE
tara:strand:+ start:234 stop:866 length:633 start_codon:yes stop_codon:yes gene_type:complete